MKICLLVDFEKWKHNNADRNNNDVIIITGDTYTGKKKKCQIEPMKYIFELTENLLMKEECANHVMNTSIGI